MGHVETMYLTDEQYDTVRKIAKKKNITPRKLLKNLLDVEIENLTVVKPNAV